MHTEEILEPVPEFTPAAGALALYKTTEEWLKPFAETGLPGTPNGIGDINSTAKGTGARFNQGKPDLSLIPLSILAKQLSDAACEWTPDQWYAIHCLESLGKFQSTHDVADLENALSVLGDGVWAEMARVFDYGRRKYKAWNWARGMPWSVPLACAARHIIWGILLEPGTDGAVDEESGHPHRGHLGCNIMMLLQYAKTFTEGNDLPPKGML